MWDYSYQDYIKDSPTKKAHVQPGQGIVGCEMNERYGWGDLDDELYQQSKRSSLTKTFCKTKRE